MDGDDDDGVAPAAAGEEEQDENQKTGLDEATIAENSARPYR